MTRGSMRDSSAENKLEDPRLPRDLIDSLPDQVYVKDTEGRFLFSNAGHLRALGAASREEVAGKTDFDFYPRELAERYRADEQEVIRTGRPLIGREEPNVDEDGNERWHSTTRVPLQDDGGKVVALVGVTRDVTERREAEKALRESEGRFRQLFERSTDALLVHDDEGRMVDCNGEACRSLGYTREEMLELSVQDFVVDMLSEEERRAQRGNTPWTRAMAAGPGTVVDFHENEHRRKDGTTFPVEVGIGTIDYGGRRLIFASCRDLTERKRAEEALRESEERYRAVMEQSVETIYLFDAHTKQVLESNAAFRRLMGYSEEELLGMRIYDFIDHEKEDIDAHVRRSLEEERRHIGERRYCRKDGSVLLVETSATVIPYAGKTAICAVSRDVTERREAEEALKESEERYRTVVEQSAESIWLFDPHTKQVLQSNTAFQQMLGYSAQELANMTNYDFVAHEREDIDSAVRRVVQERRGFSGERKYRRKDGSVLDVEVSGTVIPYKGREVVCGVARDLTERKRAEEALKESEERFRSLIQNSSDVIAIIGADAVTRYVSPSIERVLGYRPEERIGEKTFESSIVYPDDIDKVREVFLDIARDPGATATTEFRMVHADGSTRYVEAIGKNLLDDSRVGGVVVNYRDISERREAEEALRESEERFRSLNQNASDLITILEADGTVRYDSPAIERMLGYKPEDRIGKNASEYVHPDDVERVQRSFAEVLDNPGVVQSPIEFRLRHKDGSWRHVEVTRSNLLADPAVRGVVANVRDVTERKEAEAKIRKAEKKYRDIFENAAEGIYQTTPEGRFISINPALARLFGYASPEEVDTTVNDLGRQIYVDPNRREEFVRLAQENEVVSEFESQIRRKDGSIAWVSENARAVYDDDGALLYYEGFVEDVTERKHTEEALKESEERHRALVEQSVEAIYLFDPDTKRVLESNPAFEDLIGYTSEELCEMTLYDFVAHAREDIDRNVERHVVEERRFVGERRYRRKDSRLLEVAVSATMIPYHGEEAVCCVVRDVTESRALEEQLRHRAFHDSLTELPNRALLLDRLEHALARANRNGGPVAVLLMDLDDFKVINDSLGHDAGNAVLVELAERLKACVRPGDTVGRLFGDEFAVLLEAPAGIEDARRATERIQGRLRAPFAVDGREVFVNPSVGIALGDPARDQPKDVLRHADLAMYEAKSRGKSRYEVFAPSMRTRATERLDMESDLRRAVEGEEFMAYYQPVIDLRTGELGGFEALARWGHPERGMVAAGEFIQLAEETGLIRPIGRWVFEEACRQAREWRERYPDKAPLMSVNLSAAQFAHQPDLIPQILNNTGLHPEGLQLEITERAVMDDAEFALGKLQSLKGLGVSFAIDDYGTGYSCLYYLKRMPVDFLKIDRTFIAGLGNDPGDQAIVAGTIGMGHALGLKVVGEGVETAEQLRRLREMGCDLAQGFYFAEPLPGEAAERMLVEGVSF
jgi:diguanylate cyclase (GGDEF)-like protein/PAS domain S-box-containing protein